mgnify:CR=1 FL=1
MENPGYGEEITGEELLRRYEKGERDFRGIQLDKSKSLTRVNLQGADFRNACLYMANFGAADFRNANFSEGCILYSSDFTGADFRGANLQGTEFGDAILNAANFSGADLPNASFDCADAEAANFTGATLEGAILHNTIMPDGSIVSNNSTNEK